MSNLPVGPVELNERERVKEIRISAFRHRTLLRQRHKCCLERAFVCWDFAFSSRKTRHCLTTRCSQQRRRRSAAATLVQWRAEASKVRRCRRLGVIYVTRRLDVTLGTFVSEWQLLVLMRRKCFKFFRKQNEGKGVFVCFPGLASSLPDSQDLKSPYSSVHEQDRTSFDPSQHSRMEGSSTHEEKDGDTGIKNHANLAVLYSAHLLPGVT